MLAQELVPKVGGGRIAAYEMLVVTPAIGNLIRENKTFRITSAIQTGAKYGMILMDDSLFNLWREGKCDKEEVLLKAHLPRGIESANRQGRTRDSQRPGGKLTREKTRGETPKTPASMPGRIRAVEDRGW